MTISVRFFASIRESTGKTEEILDFRPSATVADIWSQASKVDRPVNLLVAVNQEYVSWDHCPGDGDEVAFFPPVTGG